MTIIGMAIVTARLWHEVRPLRAEVRRLRDEVGALSIDDPKKVYAIQVRTTPDYIWKWRVWVPEGRTYLLKYAGENIPNAGIPKPNGSITVNTIGETWVQFNISPEAAATRWAGSLQTPGGSVGGASQDWVKWKRQVSSGESVVHATKEFEPDKVIVLARHRVSEKATSSNQVEDPSAGFMIWLEPATASVSPGTTQSVSNGSASQSQK
jgi:hypothetical protein